MDYNSMLEVVRKQNPDMPYREQQKTAKQALADFKQGTKDFVNAGGDVMAPVGTIKVGISTPDLLEAEKRIRQNTPDVNSIITIGREVIPDGELKRHGKNGVNTNVSWENTSGKKLPEIGYFSIYI